MLARSPEVYRCCRQEGSELKPASGTCSEVEGKAGNRLTKSTSTLPDPKAWQSPAGSALVQLTTPCGSNSCDAISSLSAWGWTYWDDQDVSLQEYLVCCWCGGTMCFCNDLRAQTELKK